MVKEGCGVVRLIVVWLIECVKAKVKSRLFGLGLGITCNVIVVSIFQWNRSPLILSVV